MAEILVERGTKSRVRSSHAVALMVKEAEDESLARSALEAFVSTILSPSQWADPADQPPYAVGPIDTPLGPFVLFDPKDLSGSQKVATIDLLTGLLTEAGLRHAVVSSPGRLDRLIGQGHGPTTFE